MTTHPDLFIDIYPNHPGFRDTDTSRASAEAMKPRAATVRLMVLEALKLRPMTSQELADYLRLPFSTVQPRTAEGRAKGLIEDSGKRGRSRDPSKLSIVWRLAKPGNA